MDIMKALRRYIADEYANKLDKTVDTSKWKIRYSTFSVAVLVQDVPQITSRLCVSLLKHPEDTGSLSNSMRLDMLL